MAGPVNPGRPPRVRLQSIHNPGTLASLQSRRTSTPQPAPPPPPKQRPAPTCCDAPCPDESEGLVVCLACGTVLDENRIVSEVTFGETSAGAAVVQGGFVGENQRHANSMGGTVAGIGGVESRQHTEARGSDAIAGLCHGLGLGERIQKNAMSWYKLALNHRFVQGRKVRDVAAVAIYLAARKQPGNTLMLMDLAERVMENVWALGSTYKKFLQTLMEKDPADNPGSTALMEIEPLMLKFCRKLEFDQDSHRVANDACLILKRMKRDWMVQGRNPAGLCGACIILAARMNNFRRTVREVVYVVKVADTTINTRLHEYRRTQSSVLTVKQFREIGLQLKTKIAPPSVYKRQEKEARAAERKRKAEALANGETGDDAEEEDVDDSPSQPVPSKPTKRQESLRKKKQNANSGEDTTAPVQENSSTQANTEGTEDMAVDVDALAGDDPDAGLDALANAATGPEADEEAIVVPKRRGRSTKKQKREPIVIDPEDLEVERDLENEVMETIQDWESTFKEFSENDRHPTYVNAFNQARALVQLYKPDRNVSNEEEIGEDEFDDDPDIRNVLLSPQEVRDKERIWLTENEEWLRDQQSKILAKALEEAQGKPKKPKQKRRHQQMGDGGVLEGQPADSAADAVKKMINKRAKHFSSHINYDVFKELMPVESPSSGGATPAEQGESPAPAQRPMPSVQVVPVGDDEEEEEEEEVEETYVEEEEDLENQYMSDEDQGFDENEDYNF